MRNHTIKERVLAILLSLLMIIPSVVFSASAADSGVSYEYSVSYADGKATVVLTAKAASDDVLLNGGAFGFTYPNTFSEAEVALSKYVTDQADSGYSGTYILNGAEVTGNVVIGEYYPVITTEEVNPYITITSEGVEIATITFEVSEADYNVASVDDAAMAVYALSDCETAYANGDYQVYIQADDLAVETSAINDTTFTWKVNEYTVTFDYNGGKVGTEESAKVTAEYGTVIGTSDVSEPSKDATDEYEYEFAGWATTNDATEANVTLGEYKITEATTLYAVYTATEKDYTVTFTGYDEDVEQTYGWGDEILAPETNPSKADDGYSYTFVGWSRTDGATEADDSLGNVDDEDIVFYPVYTKTAKSFNITYELNGGTKGENSPETYTFGETISIPDATKDGYTFGGWTLTVGDDEYVAGKSYGKVTATASWTINKYTITYTIAGEAKTITAEYGADVTAPATDRNGYTFNGWYKSADFSGEAVEFPTTMPEDGTTLYAKHTANSYSIQLVAGDGATVDGGDTKTISYTIEDESVTLPDAVKTGYTFVGWYDGENEFDFVSGETYGSYTLAPKFTVNSNTVTFADGTGYTVKVKAGSEYISSGASVAYGTTVTVEVEVATGYTGTATITPGASFTMPDENVTIGVSGITAATYDIKVDKTEGTWADGEEPTGLTYTFGDTAEAIIAKITTEPTREGYTFAEWVIDGDYVAGTTTGKITVKATWTINKYALTFDAENAAYTIKVTVGGAEITSGTEVEYSADVAVTVEAKEGYEGTATISTGATFTMPANATEITVTGITIKTFTINFVDENGEALSDLTKSGVAYGTVVTTALPAVPAKEGYGGAWVLQTDGAVVDDKLVADATYKATYTAGEVNYTVKTYTMGTDGNYGEATSETKTATAGTNVSVTPEEKTGFTVADTSVLSATVAGDGSTVLTVYYARNQYTFKTVVDDVETSATYYYEAAVTAPAVPTKVGYTFKEWTVVGADAIPTTMPANDVTATAVFEINTYTVKYYDGESELTDKAQSYEHGAALNLADVPTKEHYTATWVLTSGTLGENNTVTGELVYTAKWTPVEYTVSYENGTGYTVTVKNGENTVDTGTKVAYGTELTVEVTTADGYNSDALVIKVNDAAITDGKFTVNGDSTVAVEGVVINKYTVTYYEKVGETETAITIDGAQTTVEHGATVALPTVPAKTGYTAGAWTVTEGYTDSVATGNVKVVVTYTINQYTYTFDLAGGTAEGAADGKVTVTADYNSTLTAPTVTKETTAQYTYTFSNWDPEVPATMPVNGGSSTAVWSETVNTYKVTAPASCDEYTVTISGASDLSAVEYGTTITYKIAATDAYNAPSVTVDGTEAVLEGTIEVKGNVTIAVTAGAKKTYKITWTGSNVSTSDTLTGIEYGASKTVTFTAVDGYNITAIEAEGATVAIADDKESATVTYDSVTADKTIAVTTAIKTFEVTKPTGEGFTATITGATGLAAVEYGTVITLAIELAEGYTNSTVAVKVGGETLTAEADGTYKYTVKADTTFTVEGVELNTYTLTLPETNPAYTFSVAAKDGSTLDNAAVAHGTVIVVTFSANEGYEASTFEIGESTLATAQEVTITADTKITATAGALKKQTVTISAVEGYTVTVKNGETEVKTGDKVDYFTKLSVTVTAADGYGAATVKVNGTETTDYAEIEVKSDVTIEVTGEKKTYAVTEAASVEGKYTVTYNYGDGITAEAVPHGTVVTMTVTVDAAYSQSTPAVKAGGATLTAKENTAYTYEFTVTEAVTFEVSGIESLNVYELTVPVVGEDGVATTGTAQAAHGETYTYELTLPAMYSKTTVLSFAVDGTEKTVTAADGKFTITVENVTDEFTIELESTLVANTYTVKFTGIKTADGAADDVIKTVTHGQTVEAPAVADYTAIGDEYLTEYKFKEWNPTFDATAVVTADADYTAVYEETVIAGGVEITVNTLRGTLNTTDCYTLPDGVDSYLVNAVVTAQKGDVDVTSSFEVTEDGNTIKIEAVDGGVAAGKYTITVAKQRYLDLVITVDVTADECVTGTVNLRGGDIVSEDATANGDNKVNIKDFLICIRAFDANAKVTAHAADINEDGRITIDDLNVIKSNYGHTASSAKLPETEQVSLD